MIWIMLGPEWSPKTLEFSYGIVSVGTRLHMTEYEIWLSSSPEVIKMLNKGIRT